MRHWFRLRGAAGRKDRSWHFCDCSKPSSHGLYYFFDPTRAQDAPGAVR